MDLINPYPACSPPSPPYRAGERVQILYLAPGETIAAEARIQLVHPHYRGGWDVLAVLSDPITGFGPIPDPTSHEPGQRRVSDAEALDRIGALVADPDWHCGLIEYVAAAVTDTGRTFASEPDPLDQPIPLWPVETTGQSTRASSHNPKESA